MKKNMKKIVSTMFLLLFGFLVFAACAKPANVKEENAKTIKVALSDDYAPMEYRDENNELVGFDIDLINALGKELGAEMEIVTIAWDGIFVGLNKDKYDMIISAISITPERIESYEMTKPYLASGQVVVVNKNNSEIKVADDLKDKEIGVQVKSTGAEAAEKQQKITPFEITAYDDVVAVFNDLKSSRKDAAVCDYLVAMEYVAKNPDDFLITEIVLSNEPLAVTMKKGNTELKDAVNNAIENMRKNGELKKISEKWFTKDYTSNIDENID